MQIGSMFVYKRAVRRAIQNVRLIFFFIVISIESFYLYVEAIRDRMGYTFVCHNEYIGNNINVQKTFENEHKLEESLK